MTETHQTASPRDATSSAGAAIGIGLGLAVGVLVYILSAWSMPFVGWWDFDNLYFQADATLVFTNMTELDSNHYRTGMHPGFSILALPATEVLRMIPGVGAEMSVRLLLALNAALQTALLFVLLRRLPLAVVPAVCFVGLFAASSAVWFWHTVPETFAFGGTTLLVMLVIVSTPAPRDGALIFGNVVAMSMTMTNWMVAFYGTVWHRWGRWRTVLKIFVIAGVIILAIGILSKLILPSAGYVGDFRRYLAWIRLPYASDWQSFFAHSIVMPDPTAKTSGQGALELVVEPSAPGSGSMVGPVAIGLWFLLCLAGVAGLWRSRAVALSGVLGLTALSQLGLHSFFADGPFLFSAHFVPLLILVAAHAALLPRIGTVVTLTALATALLVGINNATVFGDMTDRLTTELLPWLEANGVPITRPDPT